jgi:hypothetical protein
MRVLGDNLGDIPIEKEPVMTTTLIIPTLDLSTFDLDKFRAESWASLVAQGREPKDRTSWELGFEMAVIGILQPLAEKRLELEEGETKKVGLEPKS